MWRVLEARAFEQDVARVQAAKVAQLHMSAEREGRGQQNGIVSCMYVCMYIYIYIYRFYARIVFRQGILTPIVLDRGRPSSTGCGRVSTGDGCGGVSEGEG
jgi:hypothetical protein